MKKSVLIYALILCLTLPTFVLVAQAHPGRTDSRGGHTNRSTGEYHYHHGYSAHDHYDMDGDGDIDCPYAFDDKTNHSSGSSNKKSNSNPKDNTIPTFNFEIPELPTFDFDADFEKHESIPDYVKQPKKTESEDETGAKTFIFTFWGIYAAMIIIPNILNRRKH